MPRLAPHTAAPSATARLNTLAETRARIVLAARDVVAEEGWQGAQIALIAARAKVATGSVYRYFASKEALYEEVLGGVAQREVEVLQEHVDADGPAATRLAAAINAFARRAMKERRLAYALLAEPCEPEIDAARLRYRAAIAEQIQRALEAGVASGEFAEIDPALAGACIAGAFMEALVKSLSPGAKTDRRSTERTAAAIAALCVRMVLKSG